MINFRKIKTQIGVEITTQQVRATMVAASRQGIQITKMAAFPINESVGDSLREMQRQWRYRQEKIIVAISYEKIMDKIIHLPTSLNNDEVTIYIKNQRRKLFGMSADTLAIDYHPLPAHPIPHTWQVIATKNSHVKEYQTLCQRLKLNLIAIDVDMLALPRIYRFLHQTDNENIAVLQIELSGIFFCVFNQQQLIYYIRNEPQLYRQLCIQFSVTIVYLVDNVSSSENFLAQLKTIINLSCHIMNDSRLLTSFSMALWQLLC